MKYRIEEYNKHYYTGNHQSSKQLVTDGTGVAVQQVEYAPFGEVVNEYNIDWSNGQVPDFKELDEENGMYYFEARYQSPPVFISRDVMFEKYPMFSPYAFCFNNPLRVTAPTGKDGEEVVDTKNKTITINVNLIFYTRSNSISGKDVEKAAQYYKQNIMDNWSKDANGNAWTTEYNGETYTVNFNVNVSMDNIAASERKRNYNGKNNYIEIVRGGENFRSSVRNHRDGQWDLPTSSNNAGAHEFGHILGLMDRYIDTYDKEGNPISISHAGWSSHIMADSRAKVEQRNIDALVYRNKTDLPNKYGRQNYSGCSRQTLFRFILNYDNHER